MRVRRNGTIIWTSGNVTSAGTHSLTTTAILADGDLITVDGWIDYWGDFEPGTYVEIVP